MTGVPGREHKGQRVRGPRRLPPLPRRTHRPLGARPPVGLDGRGQRAAHGVHRLHGPVHGPAHARHRVPHGSGPPEAGVDVLHPGAGRGGAGQRLGRRQVWPPARVHDRHGRLPGELGPLRLLPVAGPAGPLPHPPGRGRGDDDARGAADRRGRGAARAARLGDELVHHARAHRSPRGSSPGGPHPGRRGLAVDLLHQRSSGAAGHGGGDALRAVLAPARSRSVRYQGIRSRRRRHHLVDGAGRDRGHRSHSARRAGRRGGRRAGGHGALHRARAKNRAPRAEPPPAALPHVPGQPPGRHPAAAGAGRDAVPAPPAVPGGAGVDPPRSGARHHRDERGRPGLQVRGPLGDQTVWLPEHADRLQPRHRGADRGASGLPSRDADSPHRRLAGDCRFHAVHAVHGHQHRGVRGNPPVHHQQCLHPLGGAPAGGPEPGHQLRRPDVARGARAERGGPDARALHPALPRRGAGVGAGRTDLPAPAPQRGGQHQWPHAGMRRPPGRRLTPGNSSRRSASGPPSAGRSPRRAPRHTGRPRNAREPGACSSRATSPPAASALRTGHRPRCTRTRARRSAPPRERRAP
ncbi:conserved hypothetical protein [Stigmatella aurantiaca DW4/3-1]|uniref:Uncharacterized protein n=1 Tax=Stigmatella aurantiaca (strain DW4/3-1) TaxID=378806 RepID=Q08MS8_STIAD|nr:conserved hypothetical protein [Stigmatella aurantiaca DW4/3-1]